MGAILSNLQKTVIAGFVLLVVIFIVVGAILGFPAFDKAWFYFAFRWLHVLSGIMWIGILYYFNFVQIPNMAKIPDEQKPAISKVIAPAALWWFRWGAMSTIVTGLIVAGIAGWIVEALTLGIANGDHGIHTPIGIGMWLGIIMWFNVWFIIWPNQKIALGIVDAPADAKPKAGRTAMLFSRTNTLLSIPMLFCMIASAHGGML